MLTNFDLFTEGCRAITKMPDALPSFLKQLDHPTLLYRKKAAMCLLALAKDHPENQTHIGNMPDLIQALTTCLADDPAVILPAIWALHAIVENNHENQTLICKTYGILSHLTNLLKSDNPWIKKGAIWMAAGLAKDHPHNQDLLKREPRFLVNLMTLKEDPQFKDTVISAYHTAGLDIVESPSVASPLPDAPETPPNLRTTRMCWTPPLTQKRTGEREIFSPSKPTSLKTFASVSAFRPVLHTPPPSGEPALSVCLKDI